MGRKLVIMLRIKEGVFIFKWDIYVNFVILRFWEYYIYGKGDRKN